MGEFVIFFNIRLERLIHHSILCRDKFCEHFSDIMKQPAAILVLPVLYTILVHVLPVFYQNLPVSAILVQILVNTCIFQNFPVSAILEDTGHCQNMSIADTGRFWEILVIPVLQILENTGCTSIADTGRFWKILVIPVLQILEDSGKYIFNHWPFSGPPILFKKKLNYVLLFFIKLQF